MQPLQYQNYNRQAEMGSGMPVGVPLGMPTSPGMSLGGLGSPSMLDPALLKAARHIYRTYYEVHPEVVQRPIGVAIGRATKRGKLIFGEKPVLLPHECFIPLSQIEPGLH